MIDELKIQKCVDGELSDAEQRVFLATIDATDDGWRALALAYVEEQTWNSVLSVPPATKDHPVEPSVRRPKMTIARRSSRGTMVLGLLVALAAGLLLGDLWRESQTNPHMARQDGQRTDSAVGVPVVDPQRSSSALPSAPVSQYLMNVVDADGQPHQMAYPVYDSPHTDSTDSAWRRSIPDDIDHRLLRYGYQIHRQQRVRVIPLADGGRIAFPVELIRAQPIQ